MSVTGAGGDDDVHLAVHLPADGQDALAVLIESVTREASRGVHVWVLTREPETVDAGDLAALFPDVTISVVPTRGLGTDLLARNTGRLTPRDLDLLVLSELLPSVDRVVVLPVDAVVTSDIAELYDTRPGGRPGRGADRRGHGRVKRVRRHPPRGAATRSQDGDRDRAASAGLRAAHVRLRRLHDRRDRPGPRARPLRGLPRRVPALRRRVRADAAAGAAPDRRAGSDRAARAVGLRADALGG